MLKANSSVSSKLDIFFDLPIVIDLKESITWKRNNITEESKTLYDTEGAEYGVIHGIDIVGVKAKYRISKTTYTKCEESGTTTVYVAMDDRDNIQLVLPSTGSPLILARMAALKAAKLGMQTAAPTVLQPLGDSDAPF